MDASTKQDKPVVKGPVNGNVFAVVGAARVALKRAGHADRAEEMSRRVLGGEAQNYDEALMIVMEYVEFDL